MATTTYTFADQIVKSGTLSLKVKTSFGVGGEVDTWDIYGERYFSDEITINKETDTDGGDIASENASFVIDNDASNLFENTIFAGLDDFNAWVSVEVRLNGLLIFGGVVRKSTIRYSTYYSYANRSGETSHKRITFNCVWYLDLLKNITAKNLGLYLASSDSFSVSVPHIYADGVGTGNDFRVSNIPQIIAGCFQKLSVDYGFTFLLTFGDIRYNFYGRTAGGNEYKYPSDSASTFQSFSGVGMTSDNAPSVVLQTGDGFLNGIFDERTDEYAENAYRIFVSALKSFGLFVGFRTTPSFDMNAFVSTRSSGSSVEIGEILEQSDDIYTELARDSVRINSAVSGNEYQKDFNSSGESTYSANNLFDFANDNDFGGNLGDRSNFSLVFPIEVSPTSDTMLLVRYLGVGDNLLVNGNFNPNMSGWNTSTFASDTDVLFPDGCAEATSATSKTLNQTFTADNANPDDYLFSFYILTPLAGIAAGAMSIDWYVDSNGTDVLWSSQTFGAISSVSGTIPQLIVSPVDDIAPSKIVISFADSVSATGLKIGNAKMYRRRKNTCEIMGKLIEKYFLNPNIVRKKYLFNDVLYSYSLSDFVNYNRTPYFINKIRLDVSNNETEIEAINYPY